MRAAENAAFARGSSAEALMDQAGAAIARVITRFFPAPGRCIVFIGKGHNGGDALVAAEHLLRQNWKIESRLIFKEEDCSELTRKKLRALRESQAKRDAAARERNPPDAGVAILELLACISDRLSYEQDAISSEAYLGSSRPRRSYHSQTIILDGLLGLGAKPPLREPVRTACREINRLRRETNAYVFAVDLPTGIDGESGKADRDCIVADFTVTIGFAKRGLVADRALDFVGRLEIAPSTELHPPEKAGNEIVACASSLRQLIERRKYDAYKNQFGRIGIVAGSKGFTGAAIMCAFGALRSGAGLVEIFVPEEIYSIVASAAPFEAMVKPIKSYRELLKEKIDVWGLGPGLGKSRATEVLELIEKAKQPMVVDADGLNMLSNKITALKRCKGARLLTPHPGEMKRLFAAKTKTRAETAREFCGRFPVTLLLKGSRTIVAERGRPLSYNITGNPGMATGGMGDILTGVCAALIGQKLTPYDAARLGAWICGRSAEIAIFHGGASEESLLPRDVIDYLGAAFNELRDANP
jgi:hydroxyethylthiazole kinase-like uncharacterized protein yjeF